MHIRIFAISLKVVSKVCNATFRQAFLYRPSFRTYDLAGLQNLLVIDALLIFPSMQENLVTLYCIDGI